VFSDPINFTDSDGLQANPTDNLIYSPDTNTQSVADFKEYAVPIALAVGSLTPARGISAIATLVGLIKAAIDGDPVAAAGALLGLKGLKDPKKLIGALSSATSKGITAEKLAEELKRIKDSKSRKNDAPKECR